MDDRFYIGAGWKRMQIIEEVECFIAARKRRTKYLTNIEKNCLNELLAQIIKLPLEPKNVSPLPQAHPPQAPAEEADSTKEAAEIEIPGLSAEETKAWLAKQPKDIQEI